MMKARLTVRAGIAGKIGARGWYQNKKKFSNK